MVWRRVEGAFLVTLVIKNREELLEPEERLLAWLRWIVQTLPQGSRWHPVWQRYLELIAGRVSGFGGDPGKIVPSSTGTVPHHGKPPYAGPTEEHRREFTGKVIGLIHDRFGDFDGFLLLTEHGDETCSAAASTQLSDWLSKPGLIGQWSASSPNIRDHMCRLRSSFGAHRSRPNTRFLPRQSRVYASKKGTPRSPFTTPATPSSIGAESEEDPPPPALGGVGHADWANVARARGGCRNWIGCSRQKRRVLGLGRPHTIADTRPT